MITLNNVYLRITDQSGLDKTLLKDVNFHLSRGEFGLLIGPSGSGKSSLLSIIAGLRRPTEGDVRIDGLSISRIPDRFSSELRRTQIGFIFQKFNLIPDLSVRENIILPLLPTSLSNETIQLRLSELLHSLGLMHLEHQTVNLLSGGEQQRVAIGRALINKPKIILADEPTANLDEDLFQQFLETLETLKQSGITLVLASHDPRFVKANLFDSKVQLLKGSLSIA
jgi:putative ABC transport system ATP-binding protein